jgi:hypothetical protein
MKGELNALQLPKTGAVEIVLGFLKTSLNLREHTVKSDNRRWARGIAAA